jgi:hypothetical protein
MDVATPGKQPWTNVPAKIDINKGKTITISLDDTKTNHHFAGQPVHGVVTSLTPCSDQPGPNMEILPSCSSTGSSSSTTNSSSKETLSQTQLQQSQLQTSSNNTNNTSAVGNTNQLDVSVAPSKNPIAVGDTQAITIMVSDANTKNMIPGATISASLIEPAVSGRMKNMEMSRAHQFQEVTDSTGHASLLFKIKSNTKPGTYNILVNVSADGYQPKTATATFEAIKG